MDLLPKGNATAMLLKLIQTTVQNCSYILCASSSSAAAAAESAAAVLVLIVVVS
jgi:hypothetical protein